jgi:mono/diheme cytochrome c family protein
MTLYMLFAGLGVLVYLGAAYAAAASGNRVYVDLGFHVALFASVAIALVALVLFFASRFARVYVFVFALVLMCAVTIVIATTRDPSEASGTMSISRSPAAHADAQAGRAQAAGAEIFRERGCVGCHRPDATGIGPALKGLFGRPVTAPSCGAFTVDEEYVREAILNPSATVAAGFAPVMPSFAGRLTEEELRALIAYVKSLSVPVQAIHQSTGGRP